jgi:hypothetical protein
MGYRWQNSFRHFSGDVEQHERVEEDTQMENKTHVFDVGIGYQLTPRWSFNVSAPFMKSIRVNHRAETETGSHGIGDMSVGAKFWLLRPPTESRQNIQFGFGMKLPTGNPDAVHTVNGNLVTVDQSIQPGDSGTGVSVDYMAFKSMGRFTAFSTGAWLLNPKNTHFSGTPGVTGARSVSVPDQYLWQAGVGYAVPKLTGLAFTGSARMEGVPARDIIGREDGFRRPGYAVSIGPGVMYQRGRGTWSVTAPIAVHRDRTRSVPDVRGGVNPTTGRNVHGDAAFADYLILVGYSTSF